MIFCNILFLLTSSKIINISASIPREIGYLSPKLDMNNDIRLSIYIYPFMRLILAFSQRGPNVKINYTSPAGSTFHNGVVFNGQSLFLPEGDCELSIFIPKGETIVIAYAALRYMTCSKVEVSTIRNMNHTFQYTDTSSEIVTDICILYAPSSMESRFRIEEGTNLGENQALYVYNHVMNSAWYDKYTDDESSGWSATSQRPWLFRFQVSNELSGSSTLSSHFIKVQCESTKEMPTNSLEYFEEPGRPKVVQSGTFKNNYIIPILGCAFPILLLASWLFATISLIKKGPAIPPSFRNNPNAA